MTEILSGLKDANNKTQSPHHRKIQSNHLTFSYRRKDHNNIKEV